MSMSHSLKSSAETSSMPGGRPSLILRSLVSCRSSNS